MKWGRLADLFSSNHKKNDAMISGQQQNQKVVINTYITIIDSQPRGEFDVEGIFQGNLDEYFVTENHSVDKIAETLFSEKCKLYDDLATLIEFTEVEAQGQGMGPNSIYVLESPYTKDQIEILAVTGKFSQAIYGAYSFKDLRVGGQDAVTENKIKKIINPSFNGNVAIPIKPALVKSPSS